MGRIPKICVWDADTLETVATISDFHQRAVTHLAFSPNGRSLLSIGQDIDHSVAVYQLAHRSSGQVSVTKIFSSKSTRLTVLACTWVDNNRFVTCGEKHIFFWTRDSEKGTGLGSRFRKAKGIFGRLAERETQLCVQPHPNGSGEVVSGTLKGRLLVWRVRNLIRNIDDAHSDAVTSMHSVLRKGMASGGREGRVQMWDANLRKGASFDMLSLGSLCPSIISVTWDPNTHLILVGTKGSEIFEVQVGWLVARLVGCSVSWLVIWLVIWLLGWLLGWLAGWPVGWLVG